MKSKTSWRKLLSRGRWIVLISALASAPLTASNLSKQAFEEGPVTISSWHVRAGDDVSWAHPDLDDSDWQLVEDPAFARNRGLPKNWSGVAWLRADIRVDDDIVGSDLAVYLWHFGASEVFVDGKKILTIGTIGDSKKTTEPRFQRIPTLMTFERSGNHQIAVRYANHYLPAFLRTLSSSPVRLFFDPAARGIDKRLRLESFRNRYLGWFLGIFLAFALLHSLLFAFYRPIRANLDLAQLCLILAGLVGLLLYRYVQSDPRFFLFSEPAMNLLGLAFGASAMQFAYRIFQPDRTRFFWLFVAVSLPISLWCLLDPGASTTAVFVLMLLGMGEMTRTILWALWRRQAGARLIGLGALSLAAGFGIGLLAYLGILFPVNTVTTFLIPFYGMVGLLVMMSVHLSRQFASIHRDLEARIVEVERLGAEKLVEERRRRHEEVERSVLQTQYEQKVAELEEARNLQLSMLPLRIPELPDLEVAAHMETASEVGGDYYDFAVHDDGALTFAIGDATGHGMRAGTMVTATKSLFLALAAQSALVDTLKRSTQALKGMNLRKLSMALILGRYHDGRLSMAMAGMPPVLVHRAGTGEIEQIVVGGMPLGAMARFPYQKVEIDLLPGDTVLLMSDGLPERRDGEDELIGYERTTAAFGELCDRSLEGIVSGLRQLAEDWAKGEAADDDTTFVLLRRKLEPPD